MLAGLQRVQSCEELAMASGGGVIITPTILGPNPGLFIMRIWQGVVEVCLRIALAVSGARRAFIRRGLFHCCRCVACAQWVLQGQW